ncbi:hypothetical protein V8G54_020794 [Vigna mungo]|uniref:Uncharacterized protein n=1 Tax=Vigna mungo TaxID=3915 RepID=A0AAQ3NG67_VIGMU
MIQTPANHSSRESFSCPFGVLRIVEQNNLPLFFSPSSSSQLHFHVSSHSSCQQNAQLSFPPSHLASTFSDQSQWINQSSKSTQYILYSSFLSTTGASTSSTTSTTTFYLSIILLLMIQMLNIITFLYISKLPTPYFNTLPFYIRQNSKGLTLLF